MLTRNEFESFRQKTRAAFLGIRYPAPRHTFKTAWEFSFYGTLMLSEEGLRQALYYIESWGAHPEDAIANALQLEEH